MYRIGIDVGGTFTDLVAVDDAGRVDPRQGRPRRLTIPRSASSTGWSCWPRRWASTLPRCSRETERIVHGTTVATNALLERKGARVGLLTTEGHRDVIEMREGLKDDRYNLRMPPPEQLVPRAAAARRARAHARRRHGRDAARPGLARPAPSPRSKRRRGRGGRRLLPPRLPRPGHELATRRALATSAAGRLCLAVLGGAAADQGVRAGLDDGRQRLCRPGSVALSGAARASGSPRPAIAGRR